MSNALRKIIKDRTIVEDTWQPVNGTEIPVSGDILLSLEQWLTHKDQLKKRTSGKLGLTLQSTDEPERFVNELSCFDLITINFPAFADGRGYSLARLLRERHDYQGEIRAVGDVLRDQLFYMQRCGFNAFAIREDRSIEDALAAYNDFSISYQAAVDHTLPIYRRTPAA